MLKSFKNLLGNNQAYLNRKTVPEKETVFFIFKEIVRQEFGQKGLEKFVPDYFSQGKLFVQASNSVWAAELLMNRQAIARKMNEKIGEDIVQEIKIK
jgi:hypothetical protein